MKANWFGKELNLNSENFNFLALFAGLENDVWENTCALLYSNIRFLSTFVQLFDEFLGKAEDLAGCRTSHWGLKARTAKLCFEASLLRLARASQIRSSSKYLRRW